MKCVDRSHWLTALEVAAKHPADEINDEWEWLLNELGLPKDCFLAVLEAIRQGRWRAAKNPKAYIKTVAKREAAKMERQSGSLDVLTLLGTSPDGEAFSMEESLDKIAQDSATSEAIKGSDGVWRRGGGWGDDEYDENNPRAGISYRSFLLSQVPKELKESRHPPKPYKKLLKKINARTTDFHIHPERSVQTKWDVWAKLAGFDEWDKRVLQCRLSEISRDRALADQPDEVSKKALQAAWRKFDRNGIERLQGALKQFSTENVPE
jgi:hypothetical protein